MFSCDDCQHSFYVPGTNLPLVIQGGCPECGGHARPERDQPSPTRGDGELRDMVDPTTQDDAGGNPLQEGILGTTDGGWQNGRVRDESFASVQSSYQDAFRPSLVPGRSGFDQCPRCKHLIGSHERLLGRDGCPACGLSINRDWPVGPGQPDEVYPQIHKPPTHPVTGEPVTSPLHVPVASDELMGMLPRQGAHGLVPCPDCGGDINHKQGHCQMCGGMGQADRSPYSKRPTGDACPMCHGSGAGESWYQCAGCNRTWDDTDSALGEIMPKGLDCPRCGSEMYTQYNSPMYPKGAWECSNQECWHMMPKDDAIPDAPPEDWGKASSKGASRDEYVTPMRNHPEASNQTPALPWQFDVEEVAEPGMDNEDAEAKINGQEKKAFLPALALGAEALLGGGAAAEGAAAGGAAAGGGGLGMGLLRKAVPSLMGSAMGNTLFGGGGGGNGSDQPNQTTDGSAEVRPMEMISADKPGGGTPGEFPKDTDAENVDPKEHNDGDHQEWQNDISVNDIGGTADPHHDDTPTPGLEALQMLLPLVVHYAESPDAGSDHPLLGPLHQLLGDEGLLNGPEDPHSVIQVIEHVKGGKPDDSTELPQNDNTDGAHDEPTTDAPSHPDHKQGASHQGPHSPEQIAAVQQLLMDQGRTDEVPNVPMQPWEYANELAQVAHKPDQPPQDAGAQPQPAQEEAPPEDTMPMPGMTAPPPGQFGTPTSRVANGIQFPPCPKCGGMHGFEPYVGAPSMLWCKNRACQHIITPQDLGARLNDMKAVHDAEISSLPETDHPLGPHAGHDHTVMEGTPNGVPAADQLGQEDTSQEQDSSGQWQTDDGQPLIVGEQYELHTPGVDIPDIVRVKAVRPESVSLEFTGAYELGFSKDVTRQEFGEMGYSLSHVRGDEPEAQSSEDANNAPAPPQPDISGGAGNAVPDSHEYGLLARTKTTRWHVKSFMPGAPGGTQPGGQCQQCGGPLQPNGSCAGCERSNLAPGAPGIPPAPGGIQNPAGGPPVQPLAQPAPMAPGGSNPSRPPQSRPPGAYSSVPTHDPETGQLLDADAQRLIARLLRNASTDTVPEQGDRDWLNDGSFDRTAGAHYSPSDQRELIDEEGTARNADKLDLSHTHYEAKRHTTADDFLFGL